MSNDVNQIQKLESDDRHVMSICFQYKQNLKAFIFSKYKYAKTNRTRKQQQTRHSTDVSLA